MDRQLYRWARLIRDLVAVKQAIKRGSPWPIVRRVINKIIGRKIVSKLYLR